MAKENYNFLFEQKENNVCTCTISRPVMKMLNTFNKTDILDIRDKHNEIGFKQIYINDFEKRTVTLVYVPKDPESRNWEFFRDSVMKNKRFLEEIKIKNKFVFIVKFPEVWGKDFDTIIQGKYSKVSKEYLSTFYENKTSILYHFSNKTEEAVSFYSREFNVPESVFNDCEIGPKIDLDIETFKLNMTSVF